MNRATCVWLALHSWCTFSCGKAAKKAGESPKWKFSGFVDSPDHQLADLVADGKDALVSPDGALGTMIKLRDPDANVTAIGLGRSAAIVESDVVHVVDAANGQLRWQQSLPSVRGHGLVAIGKTSLAVGFGDGADVLTLDAGHFAFTDQSHAVVALYFDPSGGYVLASRDELRFVEEPSGSVRWKRDLERVGEARMRGNAGESLLVIRPDRTYEEIEVAHGATIATGNCDGVTPSVDAKEDCAGPPPSDPSMENVTRAGRDTHGGDYWVLRHIDHDEKKGATATASLIARDAVGRSRWRTNWPAPLSTKIQMTKADSSVVAFVVSAATGSGVDARTVFAFDDLTGQLLFQHPFVAQDARLAGSAGTCWLVVSHEAVQCLSSRSGVYSWTANVSSPLIAAWPLPGGEALIADGDPLRLTRVDAAGRMAWRVALPAGTTVSTQPNTETSQSNEQANGRWQFSNAMGVVETGGHLSVIDLATGKLHEVR